MFGLSFATARAVSEAVGGSGQGEALERSAGADRAEEGPCARAGQKSKMAALVNAPVLGSGNLVLDLGLRDVSLACVVAACQGAMVWRRGASDHRSGLGAH